MELASAVAGDALAAIDPLLPIDTEAERWCDAWLAATVPGPSQPIALIAPGAGWGAKRWPPERYAAVARGLAERGFRVLVNCGPGEESLAAPIVASGAAVPLNVTLPQLIAMTRRITLCVGGDTGPLHLASALGRLVVGIYGPTDPSRNGPFGTHCRVLRSSESRRDHSRRSAPDPGLLTISPEDVLRAARRTAWMRRPRDEQARFEREHAGSRSRAASACRSGLSWLPSISWKWLGGLRIRSPSRGAWRWFCLVSRCVRLRRAR